MDIAVAAVMVPHAIATAFRCWRLRANIDRGVLVRFGLLSAAGGLAGALLYTRLAPRMLAQVLGALLLLTATAQLTGWSRRWRPHGTVVPALGLTSGLFGGLAGNQGGLRAAALSAFDLAPAAFVATATATGLLVDLARAPVYFWTAGPQLLELAAPLAISDGGRAHRHSRRRAHSDGAVGGTVRTRCRRSDWRAGHLAADLGVRSCFATSRRKTCRWGADRARRCGKTRPDPRGCETIARPPNTLPRRRTLGLRFIQERRRSHDPTAPPADDTPPSKLTVTLTPFGPTPAVLERIAGNLLRLSALKKRLHRTRYRLLSIAPLEAEPETQVQARRRAGPIPRDHLRLHEQCHHPGGWERFQASPDRDYRVQQPAAPDPRRVR